MSVAKRSREVRRSKPYPAYKASGVEWLSEIPAQTAVGLLTAFALLSTGLAMAATDGSTSAPVLCLDGLPRDMVVEYGGRDENGHTVPSELKCVLEVQVDDGAKQVLAKDSAHLVTGLDPANRHVMRITCDSRPLESFRFRFPTSGERDLVLRYDSAYGTWQLYPRLRTPATDGPEHRRCFEMAAKSPPR